MKFDWKNATIGIAALIIAIGGGFFIKEKYFSKPKTPNVITSPAVYGDVEKTVLSTGALEPYKLVSVGAQTSGQVSKLNVSAGDYVTKGQLIAKIDSRSQSNSLQNADAAIKDVIAQKVQAEASLEEAKLNYERQASLYKQDAASKLDYETAAATYKTDVAKIKALDAQLEQAKITQSTAKINLGYTNITAPMSGTVLTIVTKEGQTINANQSTPTIVKIGQTDKMTIRAEISEADVINVKPGMEVYFTILGDTSRKFRAVLRSIEPAPVTIQSEDYITPSTNSSAIYYNGIFDVDNSDGVLKTFMTAQVNIIVGSARNTLTIPASALGDKQKDGSYTVKVLNNDAITQKIVRTGLNDGTKVQILSGLQQGDKVVVAQESSDSSKKNDTSKMKMPRMGGL